jgi:prevent-host-death family protein
MITETSAVAFRQNLGEMLNLVQYRNDSVLIKKDGKPVAALIDAKLFERIRRMQERFDALCDRLAKTYDGVPEEVALAEIEQATMLARHETADAWRAAGRLSTLPGTRAGAPTRHVAEPPATTYARRKAAALPTKTAKQTRAKAKPARRAAR